MISSPPALNLPRRPRQLRDRLRRQEDSPVVDEDELRRRKLFADALSRGLQRPLMGGAGGTGSAIAPTPAPASFLPGESAGVPTGIHLGSMSRIGRDAGLTLPQPTTTPPINPSSL